MEATHHDWSEGTSQRPMHQPSWKSSLRTSEAHHVHATPWISDATLIFCPAACIQLQAHQELFFLQVREHEIECYFESKDLNHAIPDQVYNETTLPQN